MVKVEFKNVGRAKKCWTQEFDQLPTLPVLERAVRKSHALMSRDIQCLSNEAHTGGSIYAGIRCVGQFTVEHL